MPRFLGKIVLAALLVVAAWLGLVAVWASTSFHAVMAAAPEPPRMPLSSAQIAILLRVEDPTFFQHTGVSLADGQGVATISSAVARDLYLSDERPLRGVSGALQRVYRRVFDCCKKVDLGRDVMAIVLNAKLPKRNQLALYVADVYMGEHDGKPVVGLPMAAESYLGKPLEDASDAEFIGLVAMIKAPKQYHPLLQAEQHALRVRRIEALLAGKCKPDGWFDTTYEACDR
nr:transglycosylase domain-containing protein [uncultured Duganella sp.]